MSRGVPEVPLLPDIVVTTKSGERIVVPIPPQLRRYLQDLRQSVVELRHQQTPPTAPTNLTVTPQAFANFVAWTRPTNADYFEVLWNTSANLTTATVVNVANAQQWTDNVGQSGVTRFYWVRARKYASPLIRSVEAGPVSGTTLASGTGVTPPKLPSISQTIVLNQLTGRYEPLEKIITE